MRQRHPVPLATGALCLLAGVTVLVAAGLPNRADYTGWWVISAEGAPRYIAAEIGAYAPPLTLPTLDGGPLTAAHLGHGAPTVINFWATWCTPCRVEMPELQRVYQAHQSDGLRIIAVNLGEHPDTVRAWVDALGLSYLIALDTDGTAATDYRLRGQPTTVIVSSDGVISSIFYGAITADTLTAALAPYLPPRAAHR